MGILGTSAGEKVEIDLPNGKTIRLEILDVRRAGV